MGLYSSKNNFFNELFEGKLSNLPFITIDVILWNPRATGSILSFLVIPGLCQLKVSDSDPDLEEFVEKQPGPDKKDKPQEYFHIVNSFGRLSDSYQFTEQVPEETQGMPTF